MLLKIKLLTPLAVTLVALFAKIDFTRTITLGAVIISAFVAMGTLVTYAYGWRYKNAATVLGVERDAQQERADRLAHELAETRTEMVEQRTLKHQIKAELTAEKLLHAADVKQLEAKTDIAQLVTQLQQQSEEDRERTRKAVGDVLSKLAQTEERLLQQLGLLGEAQGKQSKVLDGLLTRLEMA